MSLSNDEIADLIYAAAGNDEEQRAENLDRAVDKLLKVWVPPTKEPS